MGSQALSSRPDNLPVSLSSLVGREREVESICARLRSSDVRLLTLTGPGGVGKTRLALEAAAVLCATFPDGVRLVELASINEPALVAQAVASELGIREQQGDPLFVTLANALSTRRLLVVLDNCEHLIGPCSELTEHLLRTCSGLRVLATSRQRLGVQGEIVQPVPPLPVPDPQRLPDAQQLTGIEAVRLFVERANAVLPGFTVTEENSSAIAQICYRLDGIPLALELAAAWVTTLSPQQIAERLNDRFRLLANRSHTTTPRHGTLRGAVEWSYDLLGDDEQTLFSRLSVFAGGCTLRAVEMVCVGDGIQEPDVVHLLARLVDTSLVVAEDLYREKRYRLPETVRLYARERLVTDGEAERTHRRHAEHYLELAEAAEPQLWGPDLVGWLDRLEVEHDNLRAALRWTVGHGEAEIAQRLGAALCRFWRVRGHASEGLRWLESGLSWSTASIPTRARALDAAGHLARDRGDYPAAERFYAQSLQLWRRLGDQRGAALALNSLGIVEQFRGDYVHAATLQEESLTLFQQLGDLWGVALSLVSLATMAQLQADPERAIELYQDALELFRRLRDTRGIAAALNNLGNLASGQDDHTAAEKYYEESLALFRELGDQHEIASCLSNLAGVVRDGGNPTRAISLYQDSLRLFATLGNKQGIAACLELLASPVIQAGEAQRAAQLLAAAETIRAANGSTRTAVPRHDQDRIVTSIRRLLGPDGFTAAWTSGCAMSLDEAIACGLASHGERTPRSSTTSAFSPLTRRECEVAALIARGLTNRQIAETLFIAERTVDTHVEHILTKLGVRGRAQVATWAIERGLVTGA